MRTMLCLATVTILVGAIAEGQMKQVNQGEIHQAAVSGLKVLREITTAQNFAVMGFDSLKELGVSELGEPLQVFMIRLDSLKKYRSGSDPRPLLTPLEQVVFPVTVGAAVKSSIVVSRGGGKWKATEFGNAEVAKIIGRQRAVAVDSTKLAPSAFSVVKIPALNLQFLGYSMNDDLMLVPLLDNSGYGFQAGVALPAARVLESLQPDAQSHDGLPR